MSQPITLTVSGLIDQLQQLDPNAEALSRNDPAVEVDLDDQPVVDLVQGAQLGDLPGAARGELGWQPTAHPASPARWFCPARGRPSGCCCRRHPRSARDRPSPGPAGNSSAASGDLTCPT